MSATTDLLAAVRELTTVVATLGERVTAIESRPAKSATKSGVRTFATKAERDAGKGFPCTVSPSCGRTNLRTAEAGASHDPKAPHWHNAA